MAVRLLPRSLERRTLLLTVVGMGLIMLAYGVWLGKTAGAERLAARMEVTDLLAQSTVKSLGGPMWDFDTPKVKLILQGLLTDRDIVSVAALDADGVELASAEAATAANEAKRVIERPVTSNGETIGSLRMTIGHDRIVAAVKEGLWRHAAVSAAVVTLMLLLLAFIGSQAMRPLRQLREAIGELSAGNLDREVPVFSVHRDVDAVARAVEGFRRNAIEMRSMREQNERLAATERARVHAAVESSHDAMIVLDEDMSVVFINGAARRMFPDVDNVGFSNAGVGREGELNGLLNKVATDRIAQEAELSIPAQDRTLAFRMGAIETDDGFHIGTSIVVTDVSQRVASQRSIERMAHEDALTRLPNRRKFDAVLREFLGVEEDVALLMLDLDRFKNVNDTLGHPAGDELLRQVSLRIGDCVREGDIVARLGGDEFAIIVAGSDVASRAKAIAERTIEELAAPFRIKGQQVCTGTSIGIATRTKTTIEADELVRQADLALYRIKDRGRGSYQFHDTAFDRALRSRQKIEQALAKAIADEKITLDYQAQYSNDEQRIYAYEALARWRPNDGPPISPGEFIPIAEESGLIEPLTELTFVLAARTAADLARRGADQRVAVNLSPALFAGDPVALLAQACEQTGCCPSRLEIKVTEAVFLERTDENRRILQRIRNMGATIALDDFGTGYSSLSTLLSFPVDRLKIDQAFVRKLDGDPANSNVDAVVRTIIDFAHSLDMRVTAEGVETQMQLARLQALGCDAMQGYLIGRPSPGIQVSEDNAKQLAVAV